MTTKKRLGDEHIRPLNKMSNDRKLSIFVNLEKLEIKKLKIIQEFQFKVNFSPIYFVIFSWSSF
jgi:hypothetical protein